MDPELQGRLWPRLSEEHFAADPTRALFQRLKTLHQAGRDWPKLAVLSKDPALPASTKLQLETVLARADRGKPLIHGTLKLSSDKEVALESNADFEGLVFDLLESYRITRKAAEHYVDAITQIADAETFDPLLGPGIVEKAATDVLSIRGQESIAEVLMHFGYQTTEEDKAKRKEEVRKMVATDRPRFKTGFAAYDEKAGGFQPGEVVLLGANTSGGKTAMELSLMLNMARMGTSVAMLQLELSMEQIDERLASSLANINSDVIRSGGITPKLQKRIDEAWDEFHEECITARSRCTFYTPSEQTVAGCEMVFKQFKYDVWFIDYVNLLTGDNDKLQGWERLSVITKQFKRLAKKYGICIVLAVQINIDKETGEVEVRYAKAMREDADVVMVWHLNEEAKNEGRVWIRHLKARQYEMFDFPVGIALHYCRFESLSMADVPTPKVKKLGKKKLHVKDAMDIAIENAPASSTFQKKDKPLVVPDDEKSALDAAVVSGMNPRRTLELPSDGYADLDEN
jgi:replicative DNA helicase